MWDQSNVFSGKQSSELIANVPVVLGRVAALTLEMPGDLATLLHLMIDRMGISAF